MTTTTPATADQALKATHRAMWALGDYPTVASELIPRLGVELVQACGVTAGQRVLDVAAGSGNAAIPAAATGAHVVAADLTPEMFPAGQAVAAERNLDIEWVTADAEDLPFATGEFDVALSCVGVMFAPHHQASADELVRVLRPGGTLGLLSWTPEGFIGEMFAALKPYAAPPAPGVQPPLRWGDEAYVRELLGDRVTDVAVRRAVVRIDRFARSQEFRNYFKTKYGPTVATYRRLGDDQEQVAALDRALDDLAARHVITGTPATMDWEYLLVTARRT